LAQPEHLEQGQDKIESASEVKTHEAIDGQYLKKCSLTELVINALWSSAEGKNGWSYTFNPLVRVWCVCVYTFMIILMDLIKILHTVF